MEATREVRLDVVVVPVDCDLASSTTPEDTSPPAAVAPIPGEVWRPLASHPAYLVSSFRRVAHRKRGLARPWQKPDQAVGHERAALRKLRAVLGGARRRRLRAGPDGAAPMSGR